MLESYEPRLRNYHHIKVTFAHADYFGHVVLRIGGNGRGASVLSTGLEFWEFCDTEDVENLIENDCQLSLYNDNYDQYWFKLTLRKLSTGDTLYFDDLDYEELANMIVAVEFVKVERENRSA